MIDAGYVRTMARYNAWQNKQISRVVEVADPRVLDQDRGAFFGSIRATLNHLLWGDTLWMSRFDPSVAPPEGPKEDHIRITPTIAVWTAERAHLDGKIRYWAETLGNVDLLGDLTWRSGIEGRAMRKPLAFLICQFFNHQTHHRGQVHAMMTAVGLTAPVSDLFLMPEATP